MLQYSFTACLSVLLFPVLLLQFVVSAGAIPVLLHHSPVFRRHPPSVLLCQRSSDRFQLLLRRGSTFQLAFRHRSPPSFTVPAMFSDGVQLKRRELLPVSARLVDLKLSPLRRSVRFPILLSTMLFCHSFEMSSTETTTPYPDSTVALSPDLNSVGSTRMANATSGPSLLSFSFSSEVCCLRVLPVSLSFCRAHSLSLSCFLSSVPLCFALLSRCLSLVLSPVCL